MIVQCTCNWYVWQYIICFNFVVSIDRAKFESLLDSVNYLPPLTLISWNVCTTSTVVLNKMTQMMRPEKNWDSENRYITRWGWLLNPPGGSINSGFFLRISSTLLRSLSWAMFSSPLTRNINTINTIIRTYKLGNTFLQTNSKMCLGKGLLATVAEKIQIVIR